MLTHQGQPKAAHGARPANASGMILQADLIRSAAGQRASRSSDRRPLLFDSATARDAEARQQRQVRIHGLKDLRRRYLVVKAKRDAAARTAAAAARAKARAQARAAAAERASRSSRRNPQAMARILLADRGWSGQFGCLDSLWTRESGWNYRAANPSSGAFGIPQALPGGKMASAGPDWRTNPVTQMKWGLDYIAGRYGSPCGAWSHSQSTGWY